MKKKISLYLMALLYMLAGINHFRNPAFYHAIIPPYVGNAHLINYVSGIAEILLATLLLFNCSRRLACYGIIIMLIAFIPAHVYMLQKDFPVKANNAPLWILWARLVLIQPLLIWWAWSVRNIK